MRDRILPRSVLGITSLLLALALGAAFSGAVLYAFYEYRLDRNESTVEELATGFDERVDEAVSEIETQEKEAQDQIRSELEPLREIAATGETLEELVRKVAPSLFFVSTLDEAGQPSVGSAFVVFSDAEETFLLTSFNTIRAATRQPAPPVRVRQGGEEIAATLHTWQEERDLALLIIDRGGLPRLDWAEGDTPTKIGERIFALSGLGSAGGSISQGFVADVSSAGIQHDIALGTHFQGGPLIDSEANVLGVASRIYSPLGFRTDGVWFGPPIRAACERVLNCPG